MRTPALVVILALALSACGGGVPSARAVAAGGSDWPGLRQCPESGSFDSYLSHEKAQAADRYAGDRSNWDELRAHGADDSYIAVEAPDSAGCGLFGAAGGGKLAYVYAIRFRDSSSAAASFEASSNDLHLSDSDPAKARAAGATVQQGAETGLGDNAVIFSFMVATGSFWVGYWQHKEFKIGIVAYDEPTAAPTAAKKIDGRVA